MQKQKHIRHTISITEAQREAMAEVANSEGLSISDICRRAIAFYIATVLSEYKKEQEQ